MKRAVQTHAIIRTSRWGLEAQLLAAGDYGSVDAQPLIARRLSGKIVILTPFGLYFTRFYSRLKNPNW